MTSSTSGAQGVLESNHALRLWAAALRTWSRSARVSSASERLRAEHLKGQISGRPPRAESDRASWPQGAERLAGPVLPGLGDVHVDELLAVLVTRHGYAATGAVRALEIALLMSGYPTESDEVQAADALQVLDSALHFPH